MNDAEAKVMSNDTEDDVRLVPVSESIRYRKRAQQASGKLYSISVTAHALSRIYGWLAISRPN